jgi:hypothetical protein
VPQCGQSQRRTPTLKKREKSNKGINSKKRKEKIEHNMIESQWKVSTPEITQRK